VYGDLPVGIDMFAAYLHQNYPAFVDDVHQCDDAMTGFSDADLLTSTASSVRQYLKSASDLDACPARSTFAGGRPLRLRFRGPRHDARPPAPCPAQTATHLQVAAMGGHAQASRSASQLRRSPACFTADVDAIFVCGPALGVSGGASIRVADTSSVNFLTETVPFLRLLHAGSASSYQHKTIDQLTRFAAPAGMRDALDENDASSVAPAVDAADGRERVQRASDAESAGEDSQDPIDE
jgi:hypothetical protein